MIEKRQQIKWPKTLRQVAEWSDSIHDFGMNLRDWQHEIQRSGIHSSGELARRLTPVPRRLASRFPQGDVADAYLAAYAEWLADRASIPRPSWSSNRQRIAQDPWFSSPLRRSLLVKTPASFRQRNIFTVPEAVFHPRPGRPRVSEAQKREKNRLRQQAFRDRHREVK